MMNKMMMMMLELQLLLLLLHSLLLIFDTVKLMKILIKISLHLNDLEFFNVWSTATVKHQQESRKMKSDDELPI